MPVFRDGLKVIVIASIKGYLIYCNDFVDNNGVEKSQYTNILDIGF